MSAHPTATPSPKPRLLVRGALALELVPGTRPGRAALRQAEAGALAERIGHDLALLAPQAASLDLVLAGAHYDPAELLPTVLAELMRDIGIPNGLAAVGYGEGDVPDLVEGTMKQQRLLAAAPKAVTEDDAAAIFRASFELW